jgi:hypothetical protein
MLTSGMSQEIPQVSEEAPKKKLRNRKPYKIIKEVKQNPKKVPKKASKSSKKLTKFSKKALQTIFASRISPSK